MIEMVEGDCLVRPDSFFPLQIVWRAGSGCGAGRLRRVRVLRRQQQHLPPHQGRLEAHGSRTAAPAHMACSTACMPSSLRDVRHDPSRAVADDAHSCTYIPSSVQDSIKTPKEQDMPQVASLVHLVRKLRLALQSQVLGQKHHVSMLKIPLEPNCATQNLVVCDELRHIPALLVALLSHASLRPSQVKACLQSGDDHSSSFSPAHHAKEGCVYPFRVALILHVLLPHSLCPYSGGDVNLENACTHRKFKCTHPQ